MSLGLYIHYPYCRRVCPYCEFAVRKHDESDRAQTRYFSALIKELPLAKERFGNRPLTTLYFGGGMPSLAPVEWISKLLDQIHRLFDTSALAEVTIEADPLAVDFEKLRDLKALGFHRLSLGIQSFDDHLLELLGRGYRGEDAYQLLSMCQELGFPKLSADLIYGVPDQTLALWQSDLKKLSSLPMLQHISLYNLAVETNGRFMRQMTKLQKSQPPDETQVAMHERAIDVLADHGFLQYEITAWAKPGYEAIHNQGYWLGIPYLGIGVSAASYLPGTQTRRWQNCRSLPEYLDQVERGELPISEEESLGPAQLAQEFVMLRLRRRAGIPRLEWERFLRTAPPTFAAIAERFLESGHLEWQNESLTFSRPGMMVSNEILSEFCLTEKECG